MSRFVIDQEARSDLKAIYRHIARDNRTAALRLIDDLYQKFKMLAAQPLLGEARSDLADAIRMFPAGNYVVLYRPAHYGIVVAQIVHAARDIETIFRRP